MDRRMQGAVLLVIVLLAAIVLPNLQAKNIRGAPVIGPIPGAPRLGECLLQTPPDSDAMANPGRSFRLGRCSVPHFGEVAEVIADVDANIDNAGVTFPAKRCVNESKYLGWTPAVPNTAAVQWRPIDITAVELEPTSMQKAFGQNWAVCVLTPTTPGASYRGTLRDGMSTGRLPSVFAECAASDDPTSAQAIGCDQPHRYEVFGFADLAAGYRDQSAIQAQCVTVVRQATRMTDPKGHGELTSRAVVFHRDSNNQPMVGFAPESSGVTAEAICIVGVNGPRLLTGTLFGIGNGALPWA